MHLIRGGRATTVPMALSLGIATGCLIAAARLQQATSAAMLPFEASEEIVEIRLPDGAMRVDDRVMESGLFEAAGSLFIGEAEVRLASRAARSRVGVVTAGLFEVLRVRHIAGRGLSSDDEMTGAERVAVLGRRYAQRHLSDPAGALGAFVTIDGRRYRVVGVVPDALDAFGRPDVLVPQRGTRGRVVEAVASAREIAFAGVLARLYPPHGRFGAGLLQPHLRNTGDLRGGVSRGPSRRCPVRPGRASSPSRSAPASVGGGGRRLRVLDYLWGPLPDGAPSPRDQSGVGGRSTQDPERLDLVALPESPDGLTDGWLAEHRARLLAATRTDAERAFVIARLAGASRDEQARALGVAHLPPAEARREMNRVWQLIVRRARRREDAEHAR